MTDENESPIRLTPPPRVGRGRSAAESSERGRSRVAIWLTTAGFLGLVAVAVAVFVALPTWVEREQPDPVATAATGSPSPDEEPRPSAGLDRGAAPSMVEATEALPAERPPAGLAKPADRALSQVPADRAPPPPTEPARDAPAFVPAPTATESGAATAAGFERAMSQALAALNEDDLERARAAFASAVSLDPASSPAAEGLRRAEEGLRSRAIAAHRAAAERQERAERWRQALDEHDAALALDPTLRFAREGRERARARADLDRKLRFHLDNPRRLSSAAVRAEVIELLTRAAEIEATGPVLREQHAALSSLLRAATTPVEVVLVSDEQTEVTVYRVGDLGRFKRRRLELVPGTYVVVGRRSGYRDVRRELEVGGAGPVEEFAVYCEEKI